MTWFRREFGNEINEALRSTPFNLDLLTAIAYQETGYIFERLLEKGMGRGDILRLCVGDTLDTPNRSAFPKDHGKLKEFAPHGPEIFSIARAALVEMAQHVPGYSGAVRNQKKFCHGFGIFQYDLQFCKQDPAYFLEKRWAKFGNALFKAVTELNASQNRIPSLRGLGTLTEMQMIHVAIAYNRGTFNPAKGLKQGHFDGSKFYGEYIFEYMELAKTLERPIPKSNVRLILAAHTSASASAFEYREMVSADFVDGSFVVDRPEVERFLGLPVTGGTASLSSILKAAKLEYTVSDIHKKDPVNPRFYVFVGEKKPI
jgi:hypothetical protein